MIEEEVGARRIWAIPVCAVYRKPCIKGIPDTDCLTAFCKLDGGVHDRLAERH
jgi:hypothetical protein